MAKEKADLLYALDLQPKDALDYFESKGYVLPKNLSDNWQTVWQEAHAKAFTVARATQMDVLQDIRGMVQKSLDEGLTFDEFKKELTPKLISKGWWGTTTDEHGQTVQLGSVRRLQTIYDTNMRTSYMSGRYKSMYGNAENRPYWQYNAMNDSRTRPAHRALDGKVFRYDDPFWNTHFPPNGWHCRCNVDALKDSDLNDKGLKVESSAGKLTTETKMLNNEPVQLTTYSGKDKAGKSFQITPDAGWNYSVGKAAFQPNLEKYDYNVAKQYVQGVVSGPPFKQFYENSTQKVSDLLKTNSNKEVLDIVKKQSGTNPNFSVAVINDEYKQILNTNYQAVQLSEYTLSKQIIEHPELTLADYQKLPDIIERAEVITQEGKNKLVFLKDGDKYNLAVIKDTQGGLYMATYYKTGERELKRRLKNGKILKNILEQ